MVNRMVGLGGDRYAGEGTRQYQHPWSRTRSLIFLVGMVVLAALLTLGGIHFVNIAIAWQ